MRFFGMKGKRVKLPEINNNKRNRTDRQSKNREWRGYMDRILADGDGWKCE